MSRVASLAQVSAEVEAGPAGLRRYGRTSPLARCPWVELIRDGHFPRILSTVHHLHEIPGAPPRTV